MFIALDQMDRDLKKATTYSSPRKGKRKKEGEKRGPQSQEIGENMDLSISLNFNNTHVLWLLIKMMLSLLQKVE